MLMVLVREQPPPLWSNGCHPNYIASYAPKSTLPDGNDHGSWRQKQAARWSLTKPHACIVA